MRALSGEAETITHSGLLLAAREGDPEAFVAFYDCYVDLVTAYLRRRVDQSDVAVDLTAEVFAVALRLVVDSGRPLPDNPAAWLFGVAHNKYVDALLRGKAESAARAALRMDVLVLDDADLHRVDQLTSEDQIMRLVDRLPVGQREAVLARVVDEQSYAEVAGRLGCSDLVARQRVSRGLRTLRNALKGSQ